MNNRQGEELPSSFLDIMTESVNNESTRDEKRKSASSNPVFGKFWGGLARDDSLVGSFDETTLKTNSTFDTLRGLNTPLDRILDLVGDCLGVEDTPSENARSAPTNRQLLDEATSTRPLSQKEPLDQLPSSLGGEIDNGESFLDFLISGGFEPISEKKDANKKDTVVQDKNIATIDPKDDLDIVEMVKDVLSDGEIIEDTTADRYAVEPHSDGQQEVGSATKQAALERSLEDALETQTMTLADLASSRKSAVSSQKSEVISDDLGKEETIGAPKKETTKKQSKAEMLRALKAKKAAKMEAMKAAKIEKNEQKKAAKEEKARQREASKRGKPIPVVIASTLFGGRFLAKKSSKSKTKTSTSERLESRPISKDVVASVNIADVDNVVEDEVVVKKSVTFEDEHVPADEQATSLAESRDALNSFETEEETEGDDEITPVVTPEIPKVRHFHVWMEVAHNQYDF